MANEIETKVLDIDEAAVKEKLAALGAQKIKETVLSVDWFRPKGIKEGEDPWFLRIRTDGTGAHEVTWKPKSEIIGNVRRHKEINFSIGDREALADLFEELGLELYAHQEKKRSSFTLPSWRFDIDQYPKMPAFMEVEGMSAEHVNEAIALLGLAGNRTWAEGERTLIQKIYGLDWYEMRF
jgi:adenylate cyclase class 2